MDRKEAELVGLANAISVLTKALNRGLQEIWAEQEMAEYETVSKSDKRKRQVLQALADGPKRFSDIKNKTGMDLKILTDVLQELTAEKRVTYTGNGVKGDPRIYSVASGHESQ